ncbi:piwi-like protein 1 isoform X2 [Ranitomeya variabilis]|uniref:piwi-like protein 1 isoform X2 n=1 Tax=Ranitomeya variabilis TaxID=490064 RepID=UPI004057C736
MSGRARSRARGRARGQEQAPQRPPGQVQQTQGPQPTVRPPQPQGLQPAIRLLQTQGPQPAVRPPQPQGAWAAVRPPQPQGAWAAVRPPQPQGPRPAVRAQHPQESWPALGPQQPQDPRPAAVRPQQPAPEPLLVGRGRQRGPPAAAAERPAPEVLQVSAGLAEVSIGERGGRRRDFHDVGVNTRQTIEHVQKSKAGSSGTLISLVTNHIKLVSRPQWALYQYHVDFNPAMESKRLRYALLYQHEETIGKARAFDGTVLFLPKRLNKVTEVFSQTRNGENVRITITLTNELPPTSPTCFHFYNIIFRRLLKIMDMKQIGRNYYNPSDATEVRAHRLSIWPGFSTSILQYESSIMLSIDVSHKVLRNETVHDIMSSLYSSCGPQRFQDACCKELIGQIVLTKYNNKTYRIDEIAWNMTPASTFKKADGSEISFVDYYKNQYNEQVEDMSQPLIVNIPRRPKPGAENGAIVLVPELCNLTGLTDRMRNDFNVMKDLAVHTRLPPDQRERQVGKFLNYIHKDESVQKELRDWGLNFDTELLQFEGRIAPPEKILQKDRSLDKAIIIGIDCYHDTLQGRRSIAGFVASTNKQMTRWFSRCVVQDQRQEIVDGLKVCMQAALHAWTKTNEGNLPQRIIIYRDGVGDGQLKTLVNYEIPQFIDCIKSAKQNYSPRLTVVVVKKRINARFFANMGGRLQNPPPGTIVDSEVTRPEWYDFFIISQSVRQGTVSPTHYNVVYDTGGLKPDHMQRLTYKLCHQYYNWPGVIRVPAPCQYAHKLAFLVGQSIHREPHNSLSSLLYYL